MPEISKPTFSKAFFPAQIRRKIVLIVTAHSFYTCVPLLASKKVEEGKKVGIELSGLLK